MLTSNKYIFIPLLACISFSASAGLQRHYEASVVDANWETRASRVACKMKHDIPRFGTVQFVRESGKQMVMAVKPLQPSQWNGDVLLTSKQSQWQHTARKRYLGTVQMNVSDPSAVLDPATTESVFNELVLGMFPVFSWTTERGLPIETQASAAVSSVRFIPAHEDFLECSSGLLSYSFDSLDDQVMLYDPEAIKVPEPDSLTLARAVEFCKADPDLNGIRISSYTGGIGDQSDIEQFMQRAKALQDYLGKQGLSTEQIKIAQVDPLASTGDRAWIDVRLFGPEPVSKVNFDTAKWNVDSEAGKSLHLLMEYLGDTGRTLQLSVDGHTDNVGRRRYNKGLSKQRANSVYDYLQKHGLDEKKSRIAYFGETKPTVKNESAQNRAINRRVELRF